MDNNHFDVQGDIIETFGSSKYSNFHQAELDQIQQCVLHISSGIKHKTHIWVVENATVIVTCQNRVTHLCQCQ